MFFLKRKPARIAVLLPTLNAARYLAEAIESILGQSFQNLELVILDGGSTDATAGIVKAYAALDRRVRLAEFPGMHPTKRVDIWMRRTKAEFVALQHSDDISYANRLARQIEAFGAHPLLAVCSAAYRSFWHERTGPALVEGHAIHAKPILHEEIKSQLLFWWVMHSPSLMLHREKVLAADLRFANEFRFCNDYWQTITNIGKLHYHNIPEELSAYRLHTASDGPRNLDALRAEERLLKERALRHFGFAFSPRELDLHLAIRLIPDGQLHVPPAEYGEVRQWMESLRAQNARLGVFDGLAFSTLLDRMAMQISGLSRNG